MMYYNYGQITILEHRVSNYPILYKFSDSPNDWCILTKYTMRISPEMRTRYSTRTGGDILAEALDVLKGVEGLTRARICRSAIQFEVEGPKGEIRYGEVHTKYSTEVAKRLTQAINAARKKWDAATKDHGGLQGLLLSKLSGDKDYNLEAYVHYASKYGAESALNVKSLVESWR